LSKKINVLVLCGGQSAEHEISLISVQNVIASIDKSKFNVQVVGIDKKGSWHQLNQDNLFLNPQDPKKIDFSTVSNEIFLTPSFHSKHIIPTDSYQPSEAIDVVLPVLHGPNGEDGTVQGLFKLAGLPFVGCGVLSSAMCMDKDITKKILQTEGIATCNHLIARKNSSTNPSFERATTELGCWCF